MTRSEILGRTDILGQPFVGEDERLAAQEGSHSEQAAMSRRMRAPAPTSSGYNSHWAYVRGGKDQRPDEYPALVAAAKKAKKISGAQFEAIARALFRSVGSPSSSEQETLRRILRLNLTRGGVTVA